nr:BTB/POZ domain and ankyrin repeat-containing protein NPR2-like isoform X1 [Coffea arabica]
MLRNPLAGTLCMSSMVVADDLIMKLLILENRVAFAQILFPQEAMLAMEIANVHSTSAPEFSRPNRIDLNEIPYGQVKRLQLRLQALQKSDFTIRGSEYKSLQDQQLETRGLYEELIAQMKDLRK